MVLALVRHPVDKLRLEQLPVGAEVDIAIYLYDILQCALTVYAVRGAWSLNLEYVLSFFFE